MKKAVGMVTVAVLAFAGLASGGDPAKKDLDMMQGKWSVQSIKESDGKNPPDDELKNLEVIVKDDTMKIIYAPKKDTLDAFKLKLDPAKKPKAVDFTHTEGPDKGKTELGIYKIEGDTVTICVNDFEKERPTEFKTKEGSKITVIVLKKMK